MTAAPAALAAADPLWPAALIRASAADVALVVCSASRVSPVSGAAPAPACESGLYVFMKWEKCGC